MRTMRPVILSVTTIIVGLALILAAPGAARAQCPKNPSVELRDGSNTLAGNELDKRLNLARCQCGSKLSLVFKFGTKIPSKYCQPTDGKIRVMAGQNCYNSSTNQFEKSCSTLQSELSMDQISTAEWTVGTFGTNVLLGNPACSQTEQTNSVFVYFIDQGGTVGASPLKLDLNMDTSGPSPVTKDGDPQGGEGLVVVNFKAAGSTSSGDAGSTGAKDKDLKGYQVFCAELDSSGNIKGAGLSSSKEAAYEARSTKCAGAGPAADAGVSDMAVPDQSIPDQQVRDTGFAPDQGATPDAGAADQGASAADSGSSGSVNINDYPEPWICTDLVATTATSTQVKGLTNGTKYRFWVIAIDKVGNPSTPVLMGDGMPQKEEDLWERYKRLGGQADGEYCFVATAAYGSYDHPHVRVLRDFRDELLLTSRPGRWLVRQYYRLSPGPARWLARQQGVRLAARAGLWPVTLAAGAVVYSSPAHRGLPLLALGLVLVLAGIRGRRRCRAPGAGQEVSS